MLQAPGELSLYWHVILECWQCRARGTKSWASLSDILSVVWCACSTAGTAPGTYVNSEKDGQADVGQLRCELGLYDNTGNILDHGNCTANPPDCGTLGKVRQLFTPPMCMYTGNLSWLKVRLLRGLLQCHSVCHLNFLYPDMSKDTGESGSHGPVLKGLALLLIFIAPCACIAYVVQMLQPCMHTGCLIFDGTLVPAGRLRAADR